MEDIKAQLGVDYVDLLLVHWPTYDRAPPAKQSTVSERARE
jgi:diketogulonate reductase-like aldo/keto reductase